MGARRPAEARPRKETETTEAPARVTRIHPGPCAAVAVDDLYLDLGLPEGDPYVVLTMVATVDGKATIDGRARPIGSDLDHLLMRRIRASVDAVMSGAGTLRAEGLDLSVPEDLVEARRERGLDDQPLAVIVAGSGVLPPERGIFRSGQTVVVFTSHETPVERVLELSRLAAVRQVPGGRLPDLREVMQVLTGEFGVRRLACEGGPTINFPLVVEGIADELFLTVAPKLAGGSATLTILAGHELPIPDIPRLELVSAHLAASELFLRYRLPGPPGGP
jgi:2,5-diamino-6-(ribosylamino)-4(3H)-pyrimidinone 5'-phosphate reductase